MTPWSTKTFVIALCLAVALAGVTARQARRGRIEAAVLVGLGLPVLVLWGPAGMIGRRNPATDRAAIDLIGVLVPAPLLGGSVGLAAGRLGGWRKGHD